MGGEGGSLWGEGGSLGGEGGSLGDERGSLQNLWTNQNRCGSGFYLGLARI